MTTEANFRSLNYRLSTLAVNCSLIDNSYATGFIVPDAGCLYTHKIFLLTYLHGLLTLTLVIFDLIGTQIVHSHGIHCNFITPAEWKDTVSRQSVR